MLSNTAEYALRAILVLAREYGAGPICADHIADVTAAPRNYLAKTLNALAKAGVVTSARGPHGGFRLAMAPSVLTVAHVMDVFDEPHLQSQCLLSTAPCDPAHPCAAHELWTEMMAARRAPLASTTIADLLGADQPDAAPTPECACTGRPWPGDPLARRWAMAEASR